MIKAKEIIQLLSNTDNINKKQIESKYYEYCEYLQNKYGLTPKPYFYNEENKNKHQGNKHKQFLCVEIHHIKEIEIPGLSKKDAPEHPWSYHLPENLVYVNLIEHLVLHLMIDYIRMETPYLNRFIIGRLLTIYTRTKWTEPKAEKIANELVEMCGGFDEFKSMVKEIVIISIENKWKESLIGGINISELIVIYTIKEVKEHFKNKKDYIEIVESYFEKTGWKYDEDISYLQNEYELYNKKQTQDNKIVRISAGDMLDNRTSEEVENFYSALKDIKKQNNL